MDSNQPKTGKYALKYGIILGVLGIVFNLMLYSQDLHYQIDLKRLLIQIVISLVLIVIVAIIGMLDFKKANNGFMSFGEGLKIGVGLALISGIIGIIFSFILSKVIDPEMQEKAIEYASQVMRDAGMSQEQINQQMESQRNPNPIWQVAGGLLFSLFLGFIGSLIPALAIQKKEGDNLSI